MFMNKNKNIHYLQSCLVTIRYWHTVLHRHRKVLSELYSDRNYSDIENLRLLYFLLKEYSKICKTACKRNSPIWNWHSKTQRPLWKPPISWSNWHFSALYYTGVVISLTTLLDIMRIYVWNIFRYRYIQCTRETCIPLSVPIEMYHYRDFYFYTNWPPIIIAASHIYCQKHDCHRSHYCRVTEG